MPSISPETPGRAINVHFPYHIAHAHQAKHGSLVDRGANGGLAVSDVRILSKSIRKCTVTGIDSHEVQGLDVVQCAALAHTNYITVNLIRNEYTYYGKCCTIHSSGQIWWFKYTVDDKSVQVGGQQRICTIDGYSMPMVCKGGLMYLDIIGKPTDEDLQAYPCVHLTHPHEWDSSVLDYTHPTPDGEPSWSTSPADRFQFDPNFDEFGDSTLSAIVKLSILDNSLQLSPNIKTICVYKHTINMQTPDFQKLRAYFG